jgi:hypothetical protein
MYFHLPVGTMGYDPEIVKCDEKFFGDTQFPIREHGLYGGMTPPPSYHSVDGLLPTETARSAPYDPRDDPNRGRAYTTIPRYPPRTEKTNVNSEPREDRRKSHRHHGSSSSYNSNWTAKLVFQELKSNLFGSGNGNDDHDSRGRRESRREGRRSSPPKVDFSTNGRNINYSVHNHWYDGDRSDDLSRTNTWPGHRTTLSSQPSTRGALPPSGRDWHARMRYQGGSTPSFEGFVSVMSPYLPERFIVDPFLRNMFDHCSHNSSQSTPYPQQNVDPWWSHRSQAEQAFTEDMMHELGRYGPDALNQFDAMFGTPFAQRQPPGRYATRQPSAQRRPSQSPNHPKPSPDEQQDRRSSTETQPPTSDSAMQGAASALTTYNNRWTYIDSIQNPYPSELPWPAMRARVSFDHMKCDAFSFFAKGCGLQPDKSKAPKLDFALSSQSQSPYTSYSDRVKEEERKRLRCFKQQMQREKLRWHEDKLRRRFPEAVAGGGEDGMAERRKAVWAAISEGSTACEKRLQGLS